jgi:hypothetical protein
MTGERALYFNKFVFYEGENLTVRRGIKWAGSDGSKVIVASTDESAHKPQIAEITRTIVIPFTGICDKWLLLEHDPKCRDWDALFEEMQRIYPDFNPDEVVTLVFFRLVE